jgi:hypothetical protein
MPTELDAGLIGTEGLSVLVATLFSTTTIRTVVVMDRMLFSLSICHISGPSKRKSALASVAFSSTKNPPWRIDAKQASSLGLCLLWSMITVKGRSAAAEAQLAESGMDVL